MAIRTGDRRLIMEEHNNKFLDQVAILLIIAFVVKLIWNSLVPDTFQIPDLTYWQAIKLMFLVNLLGTAFHI